MTEKELKRLSRSELLELLLVQTKETERLTKRLKAAEKKLSDRQLQLDNAGDIAHAVLQINGVMDAAQAAAQQYLENIARMEEETKLRCEKMLSDARQAADRILQDAENTPKAAQPDQELIGEIYALLDDKT